LEPVRKEWEIIAKNGSIIELRAPNGVHVTLEQDKDGRVSARTHGIVRP